MSKNTAKLPDWELVLSSAARFHKRAMDTSNQPRDQKSDAQEPQADVIDRFINGDLSGYLKLALIQNKETTFTSSQIERLRNDSNWRVRAALLHLNRFTPTAEQYQEGLVDGSAEVRREYARYMAITPNPDQIHNLICDPSFFVRAAIASREDCALTQEQIDWLATDKSPEVRTAIALRADIELTEDQIKSGLSKATTLDEREAWLAANRRQISRIASSSLPDSSYANTKKPRSI